MAPNAMLLAPVLAAGGGDKLPHATPEFHALIWVWGIFLLLLVILWKFAWKPLLAAIENREARIAESLEKAEKVSQEAAKIAVLQEATLNAAQLEVKKILDEARTQAEAFRKEEYAKAQGESEQFLERAKKEIELEEARARDSLKREVVDLTLQAASTVLGRALTKEDDKRLAETVVNELQQNRIGAGDR